MAQPEGKDRRQVDDDAQEELDDLAFSLGHEMQQDWILVEQVEALNAVQPGYRPGKGEAPIFDRAAFFQKWGYLYATALMGGRKDMTTRAGNFRGLVEVGPKVVDIIRSSRLLPGVVYWEIVDFKGFNDTFGHSIGNEVLRAFSDVVHEQVRWEKQLKKADFYRVGGDEFVLIWGSASWGNLVSVATEIGDTAPQQIPQRVKERPIPPVYFRAGATVVNPGESLLTAVHRADLLQYEIKAKQIAGFLGEFKGDRVEHEFGKK